MARGLLSGRFKAGQKFPKDDYRSQLDGFKGRTFAKCLEVSARLEGVAKDEGISLVRLALAWILRNDAVSCLFAGAKRQSQIDEQLDAPSTKFSDEELDRIDTILEDALDLTARDQKTWMSRAINSLLNKLKQIECSL